MKEFVRVTLQPRENKMKEFQLTDWGHFQLVTLVIFTYWLFAYQG